MTCSELQEIDGAECRERWRHSGARKRNGPAAVDHPGSTRAPGTANAFDRLEWQTTLFSDKLSRLALLRLTRTEGGGTVRIHVHRNHSFEHISGVLRVFASYAGMAAEITIGDYDDTLMGSAVACDLHLFWLDFDRYANIADDDLATWLCQRLIALRAALRAPFIVADAPGRGERARCINTVLRQWGETTPGTAILSLSDVAARQGDAFFDEGRAAITGTRYADVGCLDAARELGLKLIPGTLGTPLKAIAVDLDHTIYDGVLAEDGPHGVRLTTAHRDLQAALVELASQGMLLIICSRNEREDVARLFRERLDFPLKVEHVAAWEVSWGSKADGITRAVAALNVSGDAVLMLDDNLGELAAASRAHPGMKLLFAGHSPQHTVAGLQYVPGLWRPRITSTDLLRNADIRANRQRAEAIAAAADEDDYIRSLNVSLCFCLDPVQELQRFHDLSVKTNQFNLSLSRPSTADVAGYFADANRRAIMILLRDRLSNSGSVGSVLLHRDANRLVVDELCISCRALGRHMETLMILGALVQASSGTDVDVVQFRYCIGRRNQAALNWLTKFAGHDLERPDGTVEVPWDHASALRTVSAAPINIEWRTHG